MKDFLLKFFEENLYGIEIFPISYKHLQMHLCHQGKVQSYKANVTISYTNACQLARNVFSLPQSMLTKGEIKLLVSKYILLITKKFWDWKNRQKIPHKWVSKN